MDFHYKTNIIHSDINEEKTWKMDFWHQCLCQPKLCSTVVRLRVFLSLNIVHKVFYQKTPEYLRSFFTRTTEVHDYNTRGSLCNFKIPATLNNNVVFKSFSYNGAKAWNSLPNNIKGKPQYHLFKYALKHHLVHSIV